MSRLERWSRRKRGETEQTPASAETTPPAEGDGASPSLSADIREPPVDAPREAEAPEPGSLDHTLPDPDTLPPGSDIKAYLVSGVSAGLRKRALRRLFAASHYGIRDGLDDYDDDFREKLKPLADDVAERLRQWTRQAPDDEASEETSDKTAQSDGGPSDTEGPDDRETPVREEHESEQTTQESAAGEGATAWDAPAPRRPD